MSVVHPLRSYVKCTGHGEWGDYTFYGTVTGFYREVTVTAGYYIDKEFTGETVMVWARDVEAIQRI